MGISLQTPSADPFGTFRLDVDVYFCDTCRSYVYAPKGSPGLPRCPTRGCTRPNGFGPGYVRRKGVDARGGRPPAR